MNTLEDLFRKQLTDYFNSPAYKRQDEKRFTALKTILKDLVASAKGGRVSLYGLSAPSNDEIIRVTDCSTCAGKAAKTALARNRCETFAKSWMKVSGTDQDFVVSRHVNKTAGKPKGKNRFTEEVEDKNPKKSFFNIQAYK